MLFNLSSVNSSRRGKCSFCVHLDGAVKVDLELDFKTSRYVNLKEGGSMPTGKSEYDHTYTKPIYSF